MVGWWVGRGIEHFEDKDECFICENLLKELVDNTSFNAAAFVVFSS